MAEKNALVDNEKRNCVFDLHSLPRNTNDEEKNVSGRIDYNM